MKDELGEHEQLGKMNRRKFNVSALRGIAGVSFVGLVSQVASAESQDTRCNLYKGSGVRYEDETCGSLTTEPIDTNDENCNVAYKKDGDGDKVLDPDDTCAMEPFAPDTNWAMTDASCGHKMVNKIGDDIYKSTDDACLLLHWDSEGVSQYLEDEACAVVNDSTSLPVEDMSCGVGIMVDGGTPLVYDTNDSACDIITEGSGGFEQEDFDCNVPGGSDDA